jgi:uncharacterized protein (DUF2141 family)
VKYFLGFSLALSMALSAHAEKKPPADVDEHYVSPAPEEIPDPKEGTSHLYIEARNLKNDDGQVCYALFSTKSDFPRTPFRRGLATPKGGKSHVLFTNIPHGTYALAVFHDEDKDFEMDTNFVGVPQERYGFSNGARGTLGPPDWKDARFKLDAAMKRLKVVVK